MELIDKRKCLGFGDYEAKCENVANSDRSPYWCQRCDDLRIAHISKRFEEIENRVKGETS